MPESGRKWGNVITGEGHGVFFPRHSSLGIDPVPEASHSCPLQRTMTGNEVGSRTLYLHLEQGICCDFLHFINDGRGIIREYIMLLNYPGIRSDKRKIDSLLFITSIMQKGTYCGR